MNIENLKAELAKPEYAELSDQEAWVAVRTPSVPARQLVPIWQIERHSIENQYRLAIEVAADKWTPTPEAGQEQANAVYGAAKLAMRYLENPRFENLDLDLESTQQMLGGLVAGGVVPESMAAEIDAMADMLMAPCSDATLLDIIRARREITL